MKKLTAGIFATLLAVVSTGAANAEIASKGYVDQQVDSVEATVANKADSSTVTALDTRVGTAEGEIDTLQTAVAGKQDALGFTPENVLNKTTTLSGTSTDTQYPSAKAVWTAVQSVDANASVEELEGRVGELETASSTHATKTELAAKQDKLTQTGSANQPVYVDATGKVTAGNTIPTVTTNITAGQTGAAQAGAVATALAAKANTADLGDLATLDAVGSAQITDGAVATDDIASKAVTKEKLAEDIVTSLGKADTALQQASLNDYVTKTAADAAYADIATETTASTANTNAQTALTNIGTLTNLTTEAKTNTVAAINEVATEAAAAASAASAADTKAGQAQSAATAAQGEVDALEAVVNNETTGLAAAHTAIDALESGKLDKTGTAARATADASGNVITTTYATKEEIADLPTDENLALKQDKTDNSLETTNKTVVGAINEVKKQADKGVSDAATAKSAADSKLPTATYNSQVGTVTAGNMGTSATTVVAAIKEVAGEAADAQSTASSANTAAGAAQKAAEAAQATADAAIPAPDGECASGTAKCVLTFNNSVYAWEVIARNGEGE